jgi:hypothetical protein
MTAFYEIRRYEVRPGQMDAWVAHFESVILPFQVARGVVVAGIFRGETDDTAFFWIRRFESEAERERIYEDVYGSDEWKNDISPVNLTMIVRETIDVTRVVPTAMSVLR